MATAPLKAEDKMVLALADVNVLRSVLSGLKSRAVPPWLRAGHSFPDGAPPKGRAAFDALDRNDLIEVIAVRGPLHAIDGWGYLGRALNALVTGQTHSARHLAYYAELRAAMSILASAGIGVFNKQNVVVDSSGAIHRIESSGTHEVCWSAIIEWATNPASLKRLIKPIKFGGGTLIDSFEEFFPGAVSSTAGRLMTEWGFDLEKGAVDRSERNWSSYQPTALRPLVTSPAQDVEFLTMFWQALRPNGVELQRHLFRILLDAEAMAHGDTISNFRHAYDRLSESVKSLVSFEFLAREDAVEAIDHDFLVHCSSAALPASPYSMICRAGLLLKLATGMAEDNLIASGVDPRSHLDGWSREFAQNRGFYDPATPVLDSADLWEDIQWALQDANNAPQAHRYGWLAGMAGSAMRICEAERAALWGLFQ